MKPVPSRRSGARSRRPSVTRRSLRWTPLEVRYPPFGAAVWLVDDLQIGRADLAILSHSLHDRTGGVSVPYASDPAMPAEASAGSLR